MGTTTRPAVAISASRKVTGKPRRNSGIIRMPRRRVARALSGRCSADGGLLTRPSPRARGAARRRLACSPGRHRLLVGADQGGIAGNAPEQLVVAAAGGDPAVL